MEAFIYYDVVAVLLLLLVNQFFDRYCNQQGKRGTYTRAHTHRHARTLPNPEALGPEIEEGAVNRSPIQALFPLPWGGAGSAAGPGAIILQLRIT